LTYRRHPEERADQRVYARLPTRYARLEGWRPRLGPSPTDLGYTRDRILGAQV